MKKDKVIYFVPVKKSHLSKWEYYQVDLEILKELFQEVIICTSFFQVLKHIGKVKTIYCWWWHQAAPVVFLGRLYRKNILTTGAIHMYDLSGSPDFYKKSFAYRIASRISLALSDYNLFISNDQFRQVTSHLSVKNPTLLASSLNRQESEHLSKVLEKREKMRNLDQNKPQHRFLSVVWHTKDQYKRKGIFETLEAFYLLKERTDVDFEWRIIGALADGLADLEAKIKAYGLHKHVHILTDVSEEEKRHAFYSSDLYIQPSWHEGFGNAVLEAMSCGLLALVSRYTAQPEVVGSQGFVVMDIDAESIFEKVNEFILLDEDARQTLTKDMLAHIESKYSFSRRLDEMRRVCMRRNDFTCEFVQ